MCPSRYIKAAVWGVVLLLLQFVSVSDETIPGGKYRTA